MTGAETPVCEAHGEATRIACVVCEAPICPRCMTRTDVGFKCPEHAAGVTPTAPRQRRWGPLLFGLAGLILVGAAVLLAITFLDGGQTPGDPLAERGSWEEVDELAAIRGTTAAVVLGDGRLLVAGGGVGAIALDDTEILTSAGWAQGAPMAGARRGHSMVMLSDGRVMVSGGLADGAPLASTEIYDPATDSWAPSNDMSSPRLGHTLTLLPDGRVIAVGGTTPEADTGAGGGQTIGPSSSTEIFDGETWSPGPDMATERFEHTATLLDDGRLIVVGGFGPGPEPGAFTPQRSTEIFDPAVEVFIDAAPLVEARANHAAVILGDGRVLVVSGRGGSGGSRALSSAELYDPRRGGWTSVSAMTTARTGAAATLMASGEVLVTGGEAVEGGSRRSLTSAELFDPEVERWAPAGDMACPRSEHVALLLGEAVLVLAGDAAFPGQPPVAASCVDRFTLEG